MGPLLSLKRKDPIPIGVRHVTPMGSVAFILCKHPLALSTYVSVWNKFLLPTSPLRYLWDGDMAE